MKPLKRKRRALLIVPLWMCFSLPVMAQVPVFSQFFGAVPIETVKPAPKSAPVRAQPVKIQKPKPVPKPGAAPPLPVPRPWGQADAPSLDDEKSARPAEAVRVEENHQATSLLLITRTDISGLEELEHRRVAVRPGAEGIRHFLQTHMLGVEEVSLPWSVALVDLARGDVDAVALGSGPALEAQPSEPFLEGYRLLEVPARVHLRSVE